VFLIGELRSVILTVNTGVYVLMAVTCVVDFGCILGQRTEKLLKGKKKKKSKKCLNQMLNCIMQVMAIERQECADGT
jgi:arginine exporter protein ArgO